jgi:hypothetical protein
MFCASCWRQKLPGDYPPHRGEQLHLLLSVPEQDFRAFPPNEWVRSIEPLDTGSLDAFMKFSIALGTGDAKRSLSFVYPILLEAHGSIVRPVFLLFRDNWQWFFATLFIPFGIFAFRQLQSRFQQPQPIKEQSVTAPTSEEQILGLIERLFHPNTTLLYWGDELNPGRFCLLRYDSDSVFLISEGGVTLDWRAVEDGVLYRVTGELRRRVTEGRLYEHRMWGKPAWSRTA